MILTKKIKIKIHGVNIQHYREIGYDVSKIDSEIEIPINHLPIGSHVKIDCSCDNCGAEKKLEYRRYLESFNAGGYYTCQLCHHKKSKKTNLKIYGCENVSNSQLIKNKKKETNLKNWGVDNASKSKDIKDKTRKTFLKKYKNGIISGYKIKKYKNTDIYYQGSYELDFLNKYYYLGIKRGKLIKYKFNNEDKLYFPDFYYPQLNLIIEIKSSYTDIRNKDKNIEKEKTCIKEGYNYIKILDKKYENFQKLLYE